jgi:hypothetical protein
MSDVFSIPLIAFTLAYLVTSVIRGFFALFNDLRP